MASVAHDSPYQERRLGERRRLTHAFALRGADGLRVSWGGIWGGVLTAIGLLLLLAALGVAVGISAVTPGETEGSTLGTTAAIWGGLSLLFALFLGGLVSTHVGVTSDRTTAFFEGALVWVVSILLMGYFATSGVGLMASGAFKMFGGATQLIGQSVQGTNVDVSGGVDQIAQRLRDPATARQVANATGMPEQQVRSSLEDTAKRVEAQSNNPVQAANEAREGVGRLMESARSSGALERKAQEVQPQASRAAWSALGALLVSLVAALLGAMAGRRRSLPRASVRT
jgi:hypothetical protein